MGVVGGWIKWKQNNLSPGKVKLNWSWAGAELDKNLWKEWLKMCPNEQLI